MIKFLKSKVKDRNYQFILIMVALVLFRQYILTAVPLVIDTGATHDDYLMIEMAESLRTGNWLGEYSQMTLVKGISYPLFIAFCNMLSLSAYNMSIFIYSCSALVLVYALKDLIKSKKWLLFIFIVVLFNPIMFTTQMAFRVYRNVVIPSTILLLFSLFLMLYNKKLASKKKLLFISIACGLCLAFFWNIREDSIWVLPFILTIISVSIVELIYCSKKKKLAIPFQRVAIIILPFIILFATNSTISLINYKYYGIYSRIELEDSSFADAIKSIYSIKPIENIPKASVPNSSLNILFEASPSLRSIKNEVLTLMQGWDQSDKNPGDGQVEDGWFFWALRDAAARAGKYRTAQEANQFFKNVSLEIETAKENGSIQSRSTMPSALMSPWRSEYLSILPKSMLKTLSFVINSNENVVDTKDYLNVREWASIGEFGKIHAVEKLMKAPVIYPKRIEGNLKGWAFAKNEEDKMELAVVDSERNIISNLSIGESLEIYDHFINEGKTYSNAKNARYNTSFNEVRSVDKGMFLQVKINGIETFNKSLSDINVINETDDFVLCIDNNTVVAASDEPIVAFSKLRINISNAICALYVVLAKFLNYFGIFSYFTYSVLFIKRDWKDEHRRTIWLFVTGVLCSIVVLMGGVTYIEISAYPAINILYLCAAYPLMFAFSTISIQMLIKKLTNKKRIKKPS